MNERTAKLSHPLRREIFFFSRPLLDGPYYIVLTVFTRVLDFVIMFYKIQVHFTIALIIRSGMFITVFFENP